MSPAKAKAEQDTKKNTLSSKVASMAAASKGGEEPSTSVLTELLEKQREHLKEDMSSLIQTTLDPIKISIEAFREKLDTLGRRFDSLETSTSENFTALTRAEAAIVELRTANAVLLDRVDDLENRSRRVNLRIINVPEGAERGTDMVLFASGLLKEVMGDQVFQKAPELERAHRALAPRPKDGQSPRPIIVCFHRYQEKERALRWARQHQLLYEGKPLRIYPDLSANLSKKRAAFKSVKAAFYERGIEFRLLYPARLRVSYEGESHIFDTPGDAEAFFQRITKADSRSNGT